MYQENDTFEVGIHLGDSRRDVVFSFLFFRSRVLSRKSVFSVVGEQVVDNFRDLFS